jgi:hypothetical protein
MLHQRFTYLVITLLLPQTTFALPNFPLTVKYDKNINEEIQPPPRKYSVSQSVSPRLQWTNDGGYCGSLSIQQLALSYGVYLSQGQVRNHSTPGGGHDNEIVETNIASSLTTLKLTHDGWQYKKQPTPQSVEYLTWIKSHLLQRHGIVWMIMLKGGRYPIYPALSPYGFYSHVEPVYGLFTNHPLNDTTWYPDDVLATSTDIAPFTVFREFKSLVSDVDQNNMSLCEGEYVGYACVYKKWGFGWAITGTMDQNTTKPIVPVSLSLDSSFESKSAWARGFTGTLTMTKLVLGTNYSIYRWNSVEEAYVDHHAIYQGSFVAKNESYSWVDPVLLKQSGATYYRCQESE